MTDWKEWMNERKRYWQEIPLNTHTCTLPRTSTNRLSASLPGTQTHSQSNPRFREAVLHIFDSWPPPEWVSNFLKGALSFWPSSQNPEQHALRNDSTRASSEWDDLKILMMFDNRCTALSHLSLSTALSRMYASLPGAVVMLAAPVLKSTSWWPAESKQSETGCEKERPFPATNNRRKTGQMGGQDVRNRKWEK